MSASFEERQAKVATALRHNLSVLAECFRDSGIAQARIELTGSGGNGGVESVYYEGFEGSDPEAHIDEAGRVEGLQDVEWTGGGSKRYNCAPMSVAVATRKCALMALEADHPGWRKDLGAKATVAIDRDGVADLDMYQRTYVHFGEEYEAEPSPLDEAPEAAAPSL